MHKRATITDRSDDESPRKFYTWGEMFREPSRYYREEFPQRVDRAIDKLSRVGGQIRQRNQTDLLRESFGSWRLSYTRTQQEGAARQVEVEATARAAEKKRRQEVVAVAAAQALGEQRKRQRGRDEAEATRPAAERSWDKTRSS